MPDRIRLYSFADVDRSSKVRWTAHEIGLTIDEQRVKFGQQGAPDYLKLNPYAQIPTCVIGQDVLIESTAICLALAERYPESALIPGPGPEREAFWQALALATTSLEQPVVSYYLAKTGLLDARWAELLEASLRGRLETLAATLPGAACLHGTFSLADICTAYVLKLAVQGGLLNSGGVVADYLAHLRERPAAGAARFFEGLEG